MFRTFSLFFLLVITHVSGSEFESVPVAYQGRFRPAEAYARLWLYDNYHAEQIKSGDRGAFDGDAGSALDLLWQIHLRGHEPWDEAPLFWIRQAELKSLLKLVPREDRFSYAFLRGKLENDAEANLAVMRRLIPYYAQESYNAPTNRAGKKTLELTQLSKGLWVKLSGEEIIIKEAPKHAPWHYLQKEMAFPHDGFKEARAIADEFSDLILRLNSFAAIQKKEPRKMVTELPLIDQLRDAGSTFKMLPSRFGNGEWFSLAALQLQTDNFTLYPDSLFSKIKETYQSLIEDPESRELKEQLALQLKEGYTVIAGTPVIEASGKRLTYPSFNQLMTEVIYMEYPWIGVTIALYGIALILFLVGRWNKTAFSVAIIAFIVHTIILAMRCYILERPPVSNMFETVVYVPWVAFLGALILRNRLAVMTASAVAVVLLIILKIANIQSNMENVQAVLDSQYWLIVHVLMVVGSYGLFALSGLLGHIYLISSLRAPKETPFQARTAAIMLRALYFGVALLITGTILGGVWAAESWGRFWDWDPKESWAFISSCIYLIWIHAYTFRHIGNFGLAVGAITGLIAISFTWYGVNYILGTGLHSYGFGSGGEGAYFLYVFVEFAFLGAVFLNKRLQKNRQMS